MKSYILSLIFSTVFYSAMAQQPVAPDSTNKKFYAGIELTTISYIMGNREAAGGFSPYVQLNLGYRLSRRTNVQIGFAYGRDKESSLSGIYYGYGDTLIYYNSSRNNHGVAIPLTVQITPFNPNRRLNFYATASIIPVFGEVNVQETETFEGETKIMYKGHDSGVYLLATAGLMLNYKISKRLEGYGKANLLYKHVGHYNGYARRAKSIAIGLNYNFKL